MDKVLPKIRILSAGLATLIFSALILTPGCQRAQVMQFDNGFSVNLIRVPHWFPGKKEVLSPAEADVFFRRGRPDFIRFWWRPDGSLVTSSDLTGRTDNLGQTMSETPKSWIYLSEGEEVLFKAQGQSYEVQPLSPLMELVCQYGDPSNRTRPVMLADGSMRETWQWYDYGIEVTLIDKKPVGEPRHTLPATGMGTWIHK